MIIKADINDINVAAELAFKLWKHHTIDELKKEFINVLENNKSVVFIKYISDKPIGFAFCSLRNDYVEGSSTNPVGYLEGIFIDEPYRCKGYAKNLLSECEKWAKSHKCIEFASDCSIDNSESILFHNRAGFNVSNKIRACEKKSVNSANLSFL